MAYFAIEDMRKWQMWDRSHDVLGLYGKKGYDAPFLKDAIIRYALAHAQSEQGKSDSQTARFLAERRKEDPERVRDIEEALKR